MSEINSKINLLLREIRKLGFHDNHEKHKDEEDTLKSLFTQVLSLLKEKKYIYDETNILEKFSELMINKLTVLPTIRKMIKIPFIERDFIGIGIMISLNILKQMNDEDLQDFLVDPEVNFFERAGELSYDYVISNYLTDYFGNIMFSVLADFLLWLCEKKIILLKKGWAKAIGNKLNKWMYVDFFIQGIYLIFEPKEFKEFLKLEFFCESIIDHIKREYGNMLKNEYLSDFYNYVLELEAIFDRDSFEDPITKSNYNKLISYIKKFIKK